MVWLFLKLKLTDSSYRFQKRGFYNPLFLLNFSLKKNIYKGKDFYKGDIMLCKVLEEILINFVKM